MKLFSRLHSRILLLLLGIMLPVLFIVFYSLNEQRQAAVKTLKQEVTTDVRIISGLLEQKVEGARQLLIVLSHGRAINNNDPASCSKFLADILSHNPQYINLGATDPDGNIFCSAIPMTKPVNVSDLAWFQRALKSNDIAFGDYQIGRITGKPAIIIGYASRNKSGKIQAAVFVPFDLTGLSRIPEYLNLTKSTVFLILDRNGKILSRTPGHEKWVGKTIQESELIKTILTQREGLFEAKDIDGIKRIYSFTPVAGTGNSIFISIGISKDIAFADFNRRFIRNLILLGLIAVLAFAAAMIISRLARQSEEKLARSTKQFQDLYDNAPNGYISVGADSFIKAGNRKISEMLGYGTEKLLGMPVFNLYADTPDGKEKAKKAFQRFLSGETIHGEELQMQKADGTLLWASLSANAIRDSQGRILESRSIAQDITERKKAEEALRQSEEFIKTILESVDEGFIVIDPEYRIISANRAYCEQAKRCIENIIGKHCYEVSHHLDRPCFQAGEECVASHTLKTGNSYAAIHTHYDKDGAPVYVEIKSYPFKDAAGNVTAVIETINNITEKRRLEEQLRHAQKMEAIGTLVGGIAHDFNNMLNVIIGYGGIIEMGMKKDDPFLPHLKEMLAAGDKAAQLTKGLLIFSRKHIMNMKPVNINKIVYGFKKMLERIIGEDVELNITAQEEDLIVKADSIQIEQVLMNLSVNARDAMPEGGRLTIETGPFRIDNKFVTARGYGEPGEYALITVSDTGTGIDEKTKERMFEPYFTTKGIRNGTGLGLSIVYGIVKEHNGYIECASELGKGTTFRIYLPLAGLEAEKIEKPEAVALKGGNETILIAEDDSAVRNFMKQVLEDFGYKIIEAVDGEDAVNKFKEHKDSIHLILFDVIMPRKNGREAYEDIKGIKHDIKAVFISGYTPELVQSRGFIENGFEFISKPIMPNTLLKKVREVLDR